MTHVAGVDEAGMGPLAGPIVAAAVIFEPGAFIVGLDDSKRASAGQAPTVGQRDSIAGPERRPGFG